MADGKTIGKEMKYLAETEDIERDGPQEGAEDWDSLSDRVRKARKQKTLLQQHRGQYLKSFCFVTNANVAQNNLCLVFFFGICPK